MSGGGGNFTTEVKSDGAPQGSPSMAMPAGMSGFGSPAASPIPAVAPQQEALQQAPQQYVSPMQQQMRMQPPMQNPYAQQMPQQQMYRPQMAQQSQYGGLQSLLNNLINRYQQPQQRVSQAPQYQNRALGYRPSLTQAQTGLGRTATSQQEAQAAAAEKARTMMEKSADDAAFQAWQRQQYEASKSGNFGGG